MFFNEIIFESQEHTSIFGFFQKEKVLVFSTSKKIGMRQKTLFFQLEIKISLKPNELETWALI